MSIPSIQVDWAQFKGFVDARRVSIQYLEFSENYQLYAVDGPFSLYCYLQKNPSDTTDLDDFEDNYKTALETNKSPLARVLTQYELNDKDLKLAKVRTEIQNVGGVGIATQYVVSPGTFGAPNDGRYVAGGYSIVNSYDQEDYVCVYVEDQDRLLAAAYGGQTDGWMQANTEYTEYPIVKSYTDDDLPADQQGWFFWPLALGNNLDPYGECELEPIGYYGFIPAGFYVKIVVTRPNVTNGFVNTCIWWAKYSEE